MDTLRNIGHRPWPLPARRWSMTQTWHNLLFTHWPVPAEMLRPLIPPYLELDTFNGEAWVGIIAFRLSGIRLRGLPEISLVSHFPEVNVRTYVKADDKPGVLFLSLDAENPLAIALARPWFRLPYYRARITMQRERDGICIRSARDVQSIGDARFEVLYRPQGPVFTACQDTLESWLTERYCYYTVGRRGKTYRCDIHHDPWLLRKASAEIGTNTLALSHGICLPSCEPHLLYSHRMEALIWSLVGCNSDHRQGGGKGEA